MVQVSPPSPRYVGPAKWNGGSKNKPITRITIHATAGSEPGVANAAENTVSYSKNTTRPSSFHYIADAKKSLQYAYDSIVAYHAPPNEHSLGYELCCSLSNEGKGHWDQADHVSMLEIAAKDCAQLSLAYGIPIRRLTVTQLRAGERGFAGHNDVRDAWGQTDHWDPGPYFPWSSFLIRVKYYADLMWATPVKGEDKVKETGNLKNMQISMQFNDTDKQKDEDAKRIFNYAKKKKLDWVTGTEAGSGSGNLKESLRAWAEEYGYRFAYQKGQDCWLAVSRDVLKGSKWETYWDEAIPGKKGIWSAKGAFGVTFDHNVFGELTVGVSHNVLNGQPGGPNYPLTLKLAASIQKYAEKKGKGKSKFFYNADGNIDDSKFNPLPKTGMTTAMDELERYKSTGHGPIDFSSSYNKDKGVEAKQYYVLDDKEFPLNTDHWAVVTTYSVVI